MPDKELTTAESAAFHIVRRVQESADFAWLMVGTESLALCMRAVAESRGETEESIREIIDKNVAKLQRQRRPEVVELREKVEKLQRAADRREESVALREFDEHRRRQLDRVEELLRLAEYGVQDLTVESLRDALTYRRLATA